MSDVVLQSIVKRYDATTAVDNVSLNIRQGELVALLGPSGCGKTTTLRMVGGFIPVTEGRILVGGRDLTSLPPNKRNMGFGFQNYALFPHMSVGENVAFGLQMRKLPKADIARKVKTALDRVKLSHLADRLPKQLSGGQQQRVALARALVIEPDVLLLDEPLSNLDAQLRNEMKLEIRNIQQQLGITTIFVTHDQDEALSVADRVVLMRAGRIEQMGAPDDLFERPASHFVAEFMGVTNLLAGTLEGVGRFRLKSGEVLAVPVAGLSGDLALALRPERVILDGTDEALLANTLSAEVEFATYRGLVIDYRVRLPSGVTLIARRPSPAVGGPAPLSPGRAVRVSWQPEAGTLVPV
ncbi:ABC transporter ATP-binding protein [Xanthobacter oligotrophicus]|uniref:ABC transporter ATP-binding protein n=1 Tax=Xanthobacter oligotrophicus TaxID=2607286 RepID=UPI0011F3B0F9|nr:ABC transporter ATP-binding protein [Xanthobacter oligotrophicus]MCG5235727.1 ABC transporter ATP-binding protein [Xanthobacter oligotrophicus]